MDTTQLFNLTDDLGWFTYKANSVSMFLVYNIKHNATNVRIKRVRL